MSRNRGFSLIELMVVIAIIAVLAAVAVPSYKNYLNRTRLDDLTVAVGDIMNKSAIFAGTNGYYPNAYQLKLHAATPNSGNIGVNVDSSSAVSPYLFGSLDIYDYEYFNNPWTPTLKGCGALGFINGSASAAALGFPSDYDNAIPFICNLWHINGVINKKCSYQVTQNGGTTAVIGTVIPGWINDWADTGMTITNPEYVNVISAGTGAATCM